jgi:hypothetical protein
LHLDSQPICYVTLDVPLAFSEAPCMKNKEQEFPGHQGPSPGKAQSCHVCCTSLSPGPALKASHTEDRGPLPGVQARLGWLHSQLLELHA